MSYASHLRNLLQPLGIYTFREGSISGSEIESIGMLLDEVESALETAEKETLLPTAEEWGLSRRGALFARQPVAPNPELKRAALTALMQIGEDDFTQEALNRALSGCGIRATVTETEEQGCVRVIFPNTAGIPNEFDQIAQIILDIIPCHLNVEFYFRYLTWIELEARFKTWEQIEAGDHTWDSLELAV